MTLLTTSANFYEISRPRDASLTASQSASIPTAINSQKNCWTDNNGCDCEVLRAVNVAGMRKKTDGIIISEKRIEPIHFRQDGRELTGKTRRRSRSIAQLHPPPTPFSLSPPHLHRGQFSTLIYLNSISLFVFLASSAESLEPFRP